MWNPSKKVLFFIMLITAAVGGISSSWINWEEVNKGNNVFSELQTPVLLFILSMFFMVKYVKKLKSEKNNQS